MMVFKIIAAQRIFRVATGVTIQKTICGIDGIYGNIQSPRGMSNVTLLLEPIVHG